MVGDLPVRHRGSWRWPAVATWKGESLRLGRKGLLAAGFLGFSQFCVNFNAVYLAERHITSGVVATVFALLLIPAIAARLGVARPRPSQALRLELAGRGQRHRSAVRPRAARASGGQLARSPSGIGLTLVGMLGAAIANVAQARPEIRRFPLLRAARLVDGGRRDHRRHHCLRDDRTAGVRPASDLLGSGCCTCRCSRRS